MEALREKVKKLNIFKKTSGFTLAEVLITLGIIGVIAAITIPLLINNINDMQYKVAYKKAYSDASNAWKRMYADYNVVTRTGIYVTSEGKTNFTQFKNLFNVSKECFSSNAAECWDMSGEKYNAEQPDNSSLAFVDNSGRNWVSIDSGYAGELMLVDINGFKKPNQFGKDRFPFWPVLDACTFNDCSPNGSGYNIAACAGAGIPSKLLPSRDSTTTSSWFCAKPTCYFFTWLYN